MYVTYRSGDFTGLLKTYDLCDVSACNPEYVIEAGTDFELTLSDVLYVGFDEVTCFYNKYKEPNRI